MHLLLCRCLGEASRRGSAGPSARGLRSRPSGCRLASCSLSSAPPGSCRMLADVGSLWFVGLRPPVPGACPLHRQLTLESGLQADPHQEAADLATASPSFQGPLRTSGPVSVISLSVNSMSMDSLNPRSDLSSHSRCHPLLQGGDHAEARVAGSS